MNKPIAKPTYGPPVSSTAQKFEISPCVTVYIDKASGQLWEYRSHKNLSDAKRWNYWGHASECPRVWAMFLA